MQIRPDNDILAQYGTPSRPISPNSLSTPHKQIMTTGDELTETENQTTEPQAGRGPHLQQQRTATFTSQFPPELIDHIVDHLHDDKPSLIQCSRTSRVFSPATSYHMFRAVSIPSVQECLKFQELVRSSLHPPSSTSTARPSPCSTLTASSSTSPAPRATYHQITQTHVRSVHLNSSSDLTNSHYHTRHTCTSNCDVSAALWDISKFVRKIEFLKLDSQSPTEVYVSEAVKLVRMLPRIREVAFGWWVQKTGMEQIGQAFAAMPANPSHHGHPLSQSMSTTAVSMNAPPESLVGQTPTNDPLKVHLELVEFGSFHTFLDFLGSFGGRLRELSLTKVGFGRDDERRGDTRHRSFPGIECVYLGYDGG